MRGLRLFGSAGLPVDVDFSVLASADETTLAEVAEALLHTKLVKSPVQPLFGLLRWALGDPTLRPVTFWELADEVPGRFVYVDEGGRVAMSRRLADIGRYVGAVEDPESTHRALHDATERLATARDSRLGRPPCASCSARSLCAGQLKSVDEEFDCRPILRLLQRFADSADALADAVRSMPEETRSRAAARYDPRLSNRHSPSGKP